MARAATTFLILFDELCRSVQGRPEAEVKCSLRANLIRHLNAGYRAAWQFNGVAWEDSWEEGAVAVTAGVIPWSAIGDAHVFNLWSADPRVHGKSAQWIEASSSKEGLFVGETWNAGVYGFWRPVCPQWDGCSPTASMLTLLKDASLAFAQAEYWQASGQYVTAGSRRKDARTACEDLAAIEFERVQHHWWQRRRA